MNSMNMESVIERIAALERMTIRNGCTRPEAEAAARKAAELRQRYNIPRKRGRHNSGQWTSQDYIVATIRRAARRTCHGVRTNGEIYLDKETPRYGETLRIWDENAQRIYIYRVVPKGHRLIFRLFGANIRAFPYGNSAEYLRSVDVGL